MGRDLELIDVVLVLGTASAKRKAKAQWKAIFAQIKAWNREDGPAVSDDELLAQLTESQ